MPFVDGQIIDGKIVVILPEPHHDTGGAAQDPASNAVAQGAGPQASVPKAGVASGGGAAAAVKAAAAATQAATLEAAAKDGVPLCEDCSKP